MIQQPFKSLNELSKLSDFKLGVLEGSATNEMREAVQGKDEYKSIYEKFVKPNENTMITETESFMENNKVPNAGFFCYKHI